MFNFDVTNDIIRRVLVMSFPDNAINSFLQLKITPPFRLDPLTIFELRSKKA